jgi:hypothetical protein
VDGADRHRVCRSLLDGQYADYVLSTSVVSGHVWTRYWRSEVQHLLLWVITAFKFMVWLMALVVTRLTLWGRQLKKQGSFNRILTREERAVNRMTKRYLPGVVGCSRSIHLLLPNPGL